MAMKEKEVEGQDILHFVHRFADPRTLSIEEDLGHGYVRLKVTEAERRQALQDIRSVEDVVKELVRNSRDADAGAIYVSFQKEKGRWRNITVLDDGRGIPPTLHHKIFEARVTSKIENLAEDRFGVHGRGMALYSIKQVAEDVRLIASREEAGSIIQARIDTVKIPEKKDQSTFPRLEKDETGETHVVGGTRNVPWVLTELALDSRNTWIYLGSNAEILSTLYRHSIELRKLWATGQRDCRRPLWFELGRIREGKALHQAALEELGLAISERNAFRVIEGEIRPLTSVNRIIESGGPSAMLKRADLRLPSRTMRNEHLAGRISVEDMGVIKERVEDLFREIAEKYFLEPDTPVVRRRKDHLVISLGLHEKEDD